VIVATAPCTAPPTAPTANPANRPAHCPAPITSPQSTAVDHAAVAGFMANCCVESTVRAACDLGFNVVTLVDCVATTSQAGYEAAVNITYPFFSTPMTGDKFASDILGQTEKK